MQLNDMLAYKVAMLSSDLSESLAAVYEPYGLTMPEWRVMATLGSATSLTSKYIAAATRLDKVKTSRALQQLESKHLIVRETSEIDKRAINISLSAEGVRTYNALTPLVAKWQTDRLENITDDEYHIFLKVINSLSQQK